MAEYIEREAAIERLKHRRDSERFPKTKYAGLESAIFQIKHIPTADVVEVVRCKDCKYFIPDKYLDHTEYPNDLEADGLCGNIDKYTNKDRFCSSGAKMDGKGEGE